MVAARCPGCPHVQLLLPPTPVSCPCAGPAQGQLLLLLLDWEAAGLQRAHLCWGRRCPGSHGEAETDPGVLLQRGSLQAVLAHRISPAVPSVLTQGWSHAALCQGHGCAPSLLLALPAGRWHRPLTACPLEPGGFSENHSLPGLPEIAALKTQGKNPQA